MYVPSVSRTLLSPVDASFFHLDTRESPQVIASLSIFDSAPEKKLVETELSRTVELFPKLRTKLIGSLRLFWETRNDFSLESVFSYQQRNEIQSSEELFAALSQELSTGVDPRFAPWRVCIIVGGRPQLTGMLFMVHHSFADGIGGMELLEALCDKQFTLRTGHPSPARGSGLSLSALSRLANDLASPLRERSLTGVNSPTRELHARSFPLEALRNIKRALRVSLNDVYLGLLAGTMHHYLKFHRRSLEMVRAIMPVNARPLSARHSLGNHLTGVGVALAISSSDPVEWIRLVHECTQQLKASGAPDAYALLARLSSRLPPPVQRTLYRVFSRRTSFIATHFPDSSRERSLGGSRILSNYGVPALLPHNGLAFCLLTYAQQACFSVVTDPAIVPDGEKLVRFFEDAMMNLQSRAVP